MCHTAFLNLSHQDFVTLRAVSGRLIGRTCTLRPGQTNVPPFESPQLQERDACLLGMLPQTCVFVSLIQLQNPAGMRFGNVNTAPRRVRCRNARSSHQQRTSSRRQASSHGPAADKRLSDDCKTQRPVHLFGLHRSGSGNYAPSCCAVDLCCERPDQRTTLGLALVARLSSFGLPLLSGRPKDVWPGTVSHVTTAPRPPATTGPSFHLGLHRLPPCKPADLDITQEGDMSP